MVPTLPETNIAPKNGWLEYDPFLLGPSAYFQGRTVSFREGTITKKKFQVPQMEESWTLFSAILGVRFPLHMPTYIQLI